MDSEYLSGVGDYSSGEGSLNHQEKSLQSSERYSDSESFCTAYLRQKGKLSIGGGIVPADDQSGGSLCNEMGLPSSPYVE